MKISNRLMPALLAVIFLEAYVVLSAELLTLRQIIPYVGNATDTAAVIIAAVLLPLAFGYFIGGRFGGAAIRKRLIRNIIIAIIILSAGLSGTVISTFFHQLYSIGFDNRIILLTLFCLLFIVMPVYLLGQTAPLVAQFFKRESLPMLTGRILFISTLGSFMGAVFCTLALMATIGVKLAAVISIACLAALLIMLTRRPVSWQNAIGILCVVVSLALAHTRTAAQEGTLPAYSTQETLATPHGVLPLTRIIHANFLNPAKNRDVLIIGEDVQYGLPGDGNRYLVIARANAIPADKKFDLIIFHGFSGTAPDTVFYQSAKNALKPGGVFMAAFYTTPNFSAPLSRSIDRSLRTIFPHVSREILDPYDGWNVTNEPNAHVLYSYFHYSVKPDIYTDDRNRSYYDRHKIIE